MNQLSPVNDFRIESHSWKTDNKTSPRLPPTTSVVNFQWNAQTSDFGHVRTYSSLHKLRNKQGKIHGTYLGNIYGIYKEYIRDIHKYFWCKMIRNTDPMGRLPKAAPVFWLFYTINIYGYSLYILYILHIYSLKMFHVFPLCVS